MDLAKAHAKARMAMKKREEQVETEELEGGELNLVPYLDIATNILLFLLASLSSGILFGHINTSLPDHAPASSVGANDPSTPPDEQPLQLVVSITATELRLWSISQLEGSISNPKARFARRPEGAGEPYDYLALNDALYEIVKRRWPDPAARKEATHSLILQADANTIYETVVTVMDHTREVVPDENNPNRPDVGLLLFPKVHFSTGFQ
jgi:biopolymer transport protein ExbD